MYANNRERKKGEKSNPYDEIENRDTIALASYAKSTLQQKQLVVIFIFIANCFAPRNSGSCHCFFCAQRKQK